MNPRSAIHAAPADWGPTLKQRALVDPEKPDRAALLDAFCAHSDFYARRIGEADWSGVPPLEKAEVGDIPVDAASDVQASRTSGTTGYQVTVRNSKSEREFRRALLYRPQLFYTLPDQVIQVVFVDGDWCASSADPPKWFEYGGRVYQTWFCGVAADPGAIWQLLITLRPQLIRGIASGIVRFIESLSAPLKDIGVQIVGPGGEYLLPEWRALMADAFRARVLDRYGSTETGALAWQCPHCDRYHANVDEILLEAESDGLLATPLFLSSQPLLRYRLGDVVKWDTESADCVVRLPTFSITRARRDDWITDGQGRRLSPLGFQFEELPGLKAWRLHQQADGSLQLFFEAEADDSLREALVETLAAAVPGQSVELIEGVWKLERGGKFKRVSSDLSPATNTAV
ncbi:MAG: hypothetical protein ACR2QB_03015 [Gammaproteobacteria bacterium]